MLFEIDHVTRYRYSSPVSLGAHVLRFLPAPRTGQRIGACRVAVEPAPIGRVADVDCWGNCIERVEFVGDTDVLEIRARIEVETLDADTSPIVRAAAPVHADFLHPLEEPGRLDAFLNPLLSAAGNDAMALLAALNAAIHPFYRRSVRLEGPPRSPARTLALGEGVCRDLAVLFMACCRQAGLAARFVSGYQRGDPTRARRYLHAWPEVFVPGVGWRGYDPTHGTVVGAGHLAIAAAPDPAAVTPVEGGYGYTGAAPVSTLETDIRIETR